MRTYREKLREFITSKESGMLLLAEDFFPEFKNEDKSGELRKVAAFHLASDRFREKFVSLWELFDHRNEFNDCIGQLTKRAVAIYEAGYAFNTIVTCTHTARELVRHLRPEVERQLDRTIEVSEFGHYPYNAAAELELHAFRSRNVLIFTDVMASGSLVRDMTTRVERTGGKVVAGLCIVLTETSLVDKQIGDAEVRFNVRSESPQSRPDIPIFSLTDLKIPELPDNENRLAVDPDRICPIDFVNVFPERPPTPSNDKHIIHSLFSANEMLQHFKETNALTHGFFEKDDRHFLLGVRLNLLLSGGVADRIWRAIENSITPDPVLVTTFKRDDLIFARFVQDRLRIAKGQDIPLLVLKRELGDFPHLHQALYPNTDEVRERKVVLLRAAATTSEEMRSLAALLAGEQVANIQVICLVNRMGPYTVSFVQRIQALVKDAFRTGFEFVPVYHLTDIRTDDLGTMHRRIAEVLDKHARTTEVPFFRTLTQEFGQKMAPVSTATWAFESANDITLSLKLAEVAEEITRHGTRKLIALIDDPDAISDPEQAETFLLLAGLVIANIDYFRLSRDLYSIMEAMRRRLAQIRQSRFNVENDGNSHPLDAAAMESSEGNSFLLQAINDLIRLETHLLFALALLAHFEKETYPENDIISHILFAYHNSHYWHKYPLNLRYHFREGHFYWLCAFMLHGAHPDFFRQAANNAFRKQLANSIREWIEELLHDLPARAHIEDEDRKLLPGRISDHKNALLSELGVLSRSQWYQRIRFLQHHVLHRRLGHSPIWMALQYLKEDFDHWNEQTSNNEFPLEVLRKIPRHMQEAQIAAITVSEIAQEAHHFAMYPSQLVADGLRPLFGNPNAADSFQQQVVVPLLAFFQDNKGKLPATDADFGRYAGLIWQVKNHIVEPTSPFFNILLSFCIPLRELLIDVLIEVDAKLAQVHFHDVWANVIREQQSQLEKEVYVLCDPYLLREILRNLCMNVRYNLSGPLISEQLGSHVRINISVITERLPEPEAVQQEFVIITIEADGKSYSSTIGTRPRTDYTTLQNHIDRIPEFGGSLKVGDGEKGHGSCAELKVISRQHLAGLAKKNAEDARSN
jgi:hypothetical protein